MSTNIDFFSLSFYEHVLLNHTDKRNSFHKRKDAEASKDAEACSTTLERFVLADRSGGGDNKLEKRIGIVSTNIGHIISVPSNFTETR